MAHRKIKLFIGNNPGKLEDEVNVFVKELKGTLISITQSSASQSVSGVINVTILIQYDESIENTAAFTLSEKNVDDIETIISN